MLEIIKKMHHAGMDLNNIVFGDASAEILWNL